jgi:hypothetical protein
MAKDRKLDRGKVEPPPEEGVILQGQVLGPDEPGGEVIDLEMVPLKPGYRRPKALDLLIILNDIADGESTPKACERLKVSRTHVGRVFVHDPRWWGYYARALAVRAEVLAQRVQDIADEQADRTIPKDQKIDPQAARVAMEGYKWAAARFSTRYADKVAIDVNVRPDLANLTDEELGQLANLTRKLALPGPSGSGDRAEGEGEG